MTIKSYRELNVWSQSRAFVGEVYKVTQIFPREELYGLVQQIRRAAVSVPSNIAEGHSRRTSRIFLNHLNIAYGSLSEVETQLFIANDLGYITQKQLSMLLEQTAEIGKMLNALQLRIREKLTPESRPLTSGFREEESEFIYE